MKTFLATVTLAAGFLLSAGAYADPPAGATAECKDGTYYTGASHNGACKGHQGVKTWLDKDSSTGAAAASTSSSATTSSASGKTKPATTAAPAAAATTATTATGTPPAGAIARCKDGTYFSGTSHKGACKGHQGVADWLDKTSPTTSSSSTSTPATKTTTTPTPAPTPAPAPAPKPAAAPAAAPATAPTAHTPPTPAAQIEQKAGGGPGLVWVNSSSKVYHCQGDEWYGKTKEGSYMSEAAAKTAGNHAAHGKECAQ